VVFDKFHVIRNYSKAIDRVRNDEIKKAEKEDKPILRGTKYLLLKNWENLSGSQQSRLDTLLSLNDNLNVAYILKEDLKRLWDCKDREEAQQVLSEWTQAAEESGIIALIDFARMLNRYSFGLFNHCEYPINNATLEGFNNKIKVIKRRCYGFHDLEYFTLKIKQAVNRDYPPW
jgi:transposase